MKRYFALLLALTMLFMLSACGEKPGDNKDALVQPEDGNNPLAIETPPPYQTYEYVYGGFSIAVPWSMNEEPVDNGDFITYQSPEGLWSVTFKPLSVPNTQLQYNNLSSMIESFQSFGYYQNAVQSDATLSGREASYFAFERNPDWDSATMGYTLSYTEPHAFYLIDYGDAVIAGWGGLLVDVSAPEKTVAALDEILADTDVKTLLEHLEFNAADSLQTLSFPGVSVGFPARWSASVHGDSISASLRGNVSGNLTVRASIYADPAVAAGYVDSAYRTMEFGDRIWYAAVRTSTLTDSVLKGLELFTEFTEYHALNIRVNLNNWESDEDFWAFTETEAFRAIMESVELDPASFHNPEDDRKDAAGFECNSGNEISGYTGSGGAIEVPASIGDNEIVGINVNVFKGNGDITSVTVAEGITYIESQAFRDCVNLKTVILPDTLTHIDSRAFEGCTSLESVTFGGGLATIGADAFSGCLDLGDVLLPDTVSSIGSGAFSDAGSGEGRFTCPADGVVYGHTAFARAKFNSVEFGPNADLSDYNIMDGFQGSSVTVGEGTVALGEYFLIDPYAADTTLTSVTLPSTLKSIGAHAFQGRLGLREINLGSVETLGDSALAQTGLVDIVIPGTLKEIPDSAFAMCPNVRTITLDEGVEIIRSYAFSSCGRKSNQPSDMYWWALNVGQVERNRDKLIANGEREDLSTFLDITLPSTIQKIEDYAFSGTLIEGIYMLWCTSPDMLPPFDTGSFSGVKHISQVYFTQETIEAYGGELDVALTKLDGMNEPAWYYEGGGMYWSEYSSLDLG